MLNWLASEESGQGMVEYGLILALVSVAVVVVLGTMGTKLNGIFDYISGQLKAGAGS
jgi:Flp pilus assembly protein, pilin Flp